MQTVGIFYSIQQPFLFRATHFFPNKTYGACGYRGHRPNPFPAGWCRRRPEPGLVMSNSLHKDQLHEGPLTFKQSSSYGLFWFFHYSFNYCYFLVHHHHHETTFELSHYFNFLSQINMFNKVLIFAWHDKISLLVPKVPLNTNQPTEEITDQ